jgi:uncharacterized membrane protein YciS (DUF1049 family)
LETRTVDQGKPRDELLELYKLALEDYRFQVQLNWGRSQYFLVLNIGIIGIATGIVQSAEDAISPLVAVLYLAGFAFCVFSIAALQVQRKYYIAARDQKKRFENELQLGERSITPVQRPSKKIRRLTTFKSFVNIMLVGLAVLNLYSVYFVITQA